MISWIQVTFQKHTKLIFVFLLLVVAVPFVFTIGAAPGFGKAGHKVLQKPFFNYDLGKAEDQQRIIGDAEISVFLQAGFMALNGAQLQDYAFQRTAALYLADTHGIPQPTSKELTDHLSKLRLFQNAEGQFDSKRYADFTDNLKSNPQLTRADIARVMADDVRLAKIQDIIAGPGYVLPAAVRTQVRQAGTEWTVNVASTDSEAFNPDVPVNELNLAAFFEANVRRYAIPPRVSVDYVAFKPADFANEVSFTEAELLDFYLRNPARFPTSAEDTSTDTSTIPAAIRGTVENSLRDELAAKRAAKAASDFAYSLFNQKVVRNSAGLDDLIAGYEVVRKSAPPFSAGQPPKDLNWTPAIAQAAFSLTEQRYFSDPLPTSDGSTVVLLWNNTIPESIPALAEVRDAVVADFKQAERNRLFVEAGARWRSELQAKMASGMTLEAAAASMTSPKFEVTSYESFTRRNPPEKIDGAVLNALDQNPVGSLSGMISTGSKGLFVHVASRKEPQVDDSSPEYQTAREQLARLSSGLGQNLVLAELVERELAKTSEGEL